MPGKPQNDSRALRIDSLAQRNDSLVLLDDSLAAPAGLQDNPWLDTRTLKSVNLQEFIKNRALKRQSCAPNSSRVLGDIEIIVEDKRNTEQEVHPGRGYLCLSSVLFLGMLGLAGTRLQKVIQCLL